MATRKLIPQEVQRQIDGLKAATAHANTLFRQGIISREELEAVNTYALQQKFEKFMAVDEYIEARENGDWDAYEQLMNDSRTPSGEARELAMRKIAAHKIASTHLETNYQTAEDQETWAKKAHDQVKTFIDTSEFGDDPDAALVEANIRLNLGEKVSRPPPDNSKYDLHQISDDDAHRLDFYSRQAKTPGTKEWHEHHNSVGNPRNAKTGKIEKAGDFKPLDYKPKRDDDRGYSPDREFGVRSAEEAREIMSYEASRADDAAAAAEAAPAPPSDPGPTILPNPAEA